VLALAAIALGLTGAAPVARAAPALEVIAIGGATAAPGRPVFLRAGEARTLALVVQEGDRCFAAAPLRSRGRACAGLDAEVLASIRWLEARPEPRDYDNLAACGRLALARGCHAPIAYAVGDLPSAAGRAAIVTSNVPELATLGTHRVGAVLTWRGVALPSVPGLSVGASAEDVATRLVEIVVRRDDGYVGYLTEQLGTPFVYAPVRLASGVHQTDARLGADCAALVVYGRRRMGHPLRYVAPPGLRALTEPVRGAVREGDILHFGFQTAVLSVDLPPIGRLDASDLVIHTYHGVAEEVPFGTLPYKDAAMEILRWSEGPTPSATSP
jgi:hypothetical protein